MRILITGGAGFIGSHLAETTRSQGHDIHVLDNLIRGRRENVPAGVPLHVTDVASTEVDDLVAAIKPAVIVHLAAQMNVRISVDQPVHDTQINVLGTVRLLHAAQRAGAKTFIQASTGGAIYGDSANLPTLETQPCTPKSPYGISKLCGEAYLEYFARNSAMRGVALRFANVFGPRQSALGDAGVVGIFARAMLAQEAPCLFGDGLQTRDYIFVTDVVEAILAAMHHSTAEGAFNIGSGIETSLIDLVAHLRAPTGYTGPIVHADARAGEQRRSCLDNSKAADAMQWQCQISLAEGLARTVAWVREETTAARGHLT